MRRATLAFAVPVALMVAASGCASAGRATDDRLVAPAQAAALAGSRAIVLDVRPIEQYTAGHVVGARWVDIQEWSKLSRSSEQGLHDAAGWAARIGGLGIANEDVVLVYDGGEMTEAARVWYILQLLGAWNAAVVDGGWKALEPALAREQIAGGAPPSPAPKRFDVWTRSGSGAAYADKSAVRKNLASNTAQVWDARTSDEYSGADPKNNPRGGHIPGAINLSHRALLDADGRMKSADELRRLLAAAGFERGRPIITHCQSGGRASLAALAALRAGFGPVSNYYMSFAEWAGDETCPLIEPAPSSAPGDRP